MTSGNNLLMSLHLADVHGSGAVSNTYTNTHRIYHHRMCTAANCAQLSLDKGAIKVKKVKVSICIAHLAYTPLIYAFRH